jgi:hypothetical protein
MRILTAFIRLVEKGGNKTNEFERETLKSILKFAPDSINSPITSCWVSRFVPVRSALEPVEKHRVRLGYDPYDRNFITIQQLFAHVFLIQKRIIYTFRLAGTSVFRPVATRALKRHQRNTMLIISACRDRTPHRERRDDGSEICRATATIVLRNPPRCSVLLLSSRADHRKTPAATAQPARCGSKMSKNVF